MVAKLTGKTKVIGIIGHPVEHSLSPLMQNAAFQHLGLDFCYVPFPVEPGCAAQAIDAVRVLHMAGLNVTVPFKEDVMPCLDEISEDAKLLGAVNTIVCRGGRLIGYNTDGPGFLLSLEEEGYHPAGQVVTVLGAGGAARAVVAALAPRAEKIYLTDLAPRKAEDLAGEFQARGFGNITAKTMDPVALKKAIDRSSLVVNTTPVGMYPDVAASPVPAGSIASGQTAYDIVYRPMETTFLRQAREAGARAVSGLGMLVYQGALAFKLWTGFDAPAKLMKEVLVEYFNDAK